MIKPLNDNVLIQIDENKGETTTEGGIILQASVTSVNMRKATVIAVSDSCDQMQAGDEVYIPGMNLAAAQIEVDGEEMYIVIEKTIVAKVQ